MNELNWDIDRKLTTLSNLSEEDIQAATVALSVIAGNRMLGGRVGSVDAIPSLMKVAQFFADEQQRRVVRNHTKRRA